MFPRHKPGLRNARLPWRRPGRTKPGRFLQCLLSCVFLEPGPLQREGGAELRRRDAAPLIQTKYFDAVEAHHQLWLRPAPPAGGAVIFQKHLMYFSWRCVRCFCIIVVSAVDVTDARNTFVLFCFCLLFFCVFFLYFIFFCKSAASVTLVLPLDCAPLLVLFLSKSRCPVLTAGLRIYLTKEYCMFNNKKKNTKRTKNEEKKGRAEKTRKKRRNKNKKCNLYFKTACTRLGKSYLE